MSLASIQLLNISLSGSTSISPQLSIIYWPHPDEGFACNATGEIWKWVAPGADRGGCWRHVCPITSSPPPTAPLDKHMLQR